MIRLGEIAEIRSGFPFRGRVEHDPAGELAVVSMRDIEPNVPLDCDNLTRIRDENRADVDRYLLQPEDIIFQSRGYRNYATVIDQPLHGVAALGLYRLRPDSSRVSGRYLVWYLNDRRFQRKISELAQGTQIPFIPRSELAAVPVPLPAIEQQQQIVRLLVHRQRQRQLQHEFDDLTDAMLSAVTWRIATSVD